MEFFDDVKVPEGFFQLHAYDARSGKLVDYVEGHNIVVNDGREALARLLGHHDPVLDPILSGPAAGVVSWYVDTLAFGDGGHDPDSVGDQTVMTPVLVTDTGLYGTTHVTRPVTVTWPSYRKVVFEATVESTEGNHPSPPAVNEYSEAGLFYGTSPGNSMVMFAHKSFGYVVKNETIRLVATWTFTF